MRASNSTRRVPRASACSSNAATRFPVLGMEREGGRACPGAGELAAPPIPTDRAGRGEAWNSSVLAFHPSPSATASIASRSAPATCEGPVSDWRPLDVLVSRRGIEATPSAGRWRPATTGAPCREPRRRGRRGPGCRVRDTRPHESGLLHEPAGTGSSERIDPRKQSSCESRGRRASRPRRCPWRVRITLSSRLCGKSAGRGGRSSIRTQFPRCAVASARRVVRRVPAHQHASARAQAGSSRSSSASRPACRTRVLPTGCARSPRWRRGPVRRGRTGLSRWLVDGAVPESAPPAQGGRPAGRPWRGRPSASSRPSRRPGIHCRAREAPCIAERSGEFAGNRLFLDEALLRREANRLLVEARASMSRPSSRAASARSSTSL